VRLGWADRFGAGDRDVVAEEAERAVLGSGGAGVEDAAASVVAPGAGDRDAIDLERHRTEGGYVKGVSSSAEIRLATRMYSPRAIRSIGFSSPSAGTGLRNQTAM